MAWSRGTDAVVLAHEDAEPLAEFKTRLQASPPRGVERLAAACPMHRQTQRFF